MIKINQLSKSYFARELFNDVSFQMNAGDRLGLVGRNGHGKSTLFKLILGQEEPDSGEITIPRNYRIGHLEQHLHFTQPTILAETALGPARRRIPFHLQGRSHLVWPGIFPRRS